MKFIVRFAIPISYFQATRLNRWDLVAYNALVEWLPAIALPLVFSDFNFQMILTVVLSYLSFISLYEIGYITNDYYSEMFEESPRGRLSQPSVTSWAVAGVVFLRVIYFFGLSIYLGALTNAVWMTFHASLMVVFLVHNIVPKEFRLPTFFSLSTFRYFAPMILALPSSILIILLPAVLVNNSLYRIIVYGSNNGMIIIKNRNENRFKLFFYLCSFPISGFLSVLFGSLLPLIVCIYYFAIWVTYSVLQGSRAE